MLDAARDGVGLAYLTEFNVAADMTDESRAVSTMSRMTIGCRAAFMLNR